MIIKKLHIIEGIYEKTFEFGHRTLLYSSDNSQGKTTLVRLLLHSLGFDIPMTAGINKTAIYSEIIISIKSELIMIRRQGKKAILLSNGVEVKEYNLPNDTLELHTNVFGVSEINILENILGLFYVDQNRGQIVLNRGEIIGNINFNIDKLIAGMQGIDIDKMALEMNNEKKSLKSYAGLKGIIEYVRTINEHSENSNEPLDNSEQLQKREIIKLKIKDINEKIRMASNEDNENRAFLDYIERADVVVVDINGNEIEVNKNTIKGYEANTQVLLAHMNYLKIQRQILQKELISLQPVNDELIHIDDFKKRIDQDLIKLKMNDTNIDSIIQSSQAKIKSINAEIRRMTFENSDLVNYMNSVMLEVASDLGVYKYLKKDGIKTHQIQDKTGVIYYKSIISFKIAFIKTMEKYKEVNLPLVIDSFRNQELTMENADKLLSIIDKYILNHQLIITSVSRYGYNFDAFFELENPIINEERTI